MHLEPVEIQHVKLRRSLFGYERVSVDQLLENVTASYENVWFERGKLEAELASLRNRLDGQAQAKEALEGTVKVAQSTADEVLAEARSKADAVVDEAHERSLATVHEARLEHQRLRVEIKKLEVAETEITLRLRALLTAARELLDGHESIRELASRQGTDLPPETGGEQPAGALASDGLALPTDIEGQHPDSSPDAVEEQVPPGSSARETHARAPASSTAPVEIADETPVSERPEETPEDVASEPRSERSDDLATPDEGGDMVEALADPLRTTRTPGAVSSAPAAAASAAAALTSSRTPDAEKLEEALASEAAASIGGADGGSEDDESLDGSPGDESSDDGRIGPDPTVATRALI